MPREAKPLGLGHKFNYLASSPLMKKDWILTQESFDALLAWLDPAREEAGRRYEEIRRRLIKIFTCRGCGEPEDLADETINRVSKKLKEIESDYSGDPRSVFLWRRKQSPPGVSKKKTCSASPSTRGRY